MIGIKRKSLVVRELLVLKIILIGLSLYPQFGHSDASMDTAEQGIRLAVLGDSDSHSYGDTIWFPLDSDRRGGSLRAITLQWTEVLARLRADEINQGEWGVWGVEGLWAKALDMVGVSLRTPRKQDYEFNFAWSGATCESLNLGISAQADQLLRLIEKDPQGWNDGVVQIRIGINDLGTSEFLDKAAEQEPDPEVKQRVAECVDDIARASASIRKRAPGLRIVLVGILNNSDWPPYFENWINAGQQTRINAMLDEFDSGLKRLAMQDDSIAFFDDREGFRKYWGERDEQGRPVYRPYTIPGGPVITNTQGNSLENAIIADGHGGSMQNAVWVRDFLDFLNSQWKIPITPITNAELVSLYEDLKKEGAGE